MTTDENDENVEVSCGDQIKFFCKYYGPCWFVMQQTGMAYFAFMRAANDFTIASWT